MDLYQGTAAEFSADVELNRIVDKLTDAWFAYFGHNAQPTEIRAWRNSLRAFKDAVKMAGLSRQGILIEYRLPMNSKRIDCIVTGRSHALRDSATIVELKQWEETQAADGEHVVTFVGGGNRLSLHPSVQSNRYRQYLLEGHTAFYGEDAIDLYACAYLHNYALKPGDPLSDEKFHGVMEETPLFDAPAVKPLSEYIRERSGYGDGMDILHRVQASVYRPSKPLMSHVSRIIKKQERYILLDEQLVAYDLVRSLVKKACGKKSIVVVQGGPGTGKSAIAIQLLADLLAEGHATHYATGSKAFNETLWTVLGQTSRQLIRYFNQYGSIPVSSLEVLILDEAHRIRKTSNHRFTRKEARSNKTQMRELLDAAPLTVFFIDGAQTVRPDEIGSADEIMDEARRVGAEVHTVNLDAQFRCAGSQSFVNWIDNTLGIRRKADTIWEGDDAFDFKIAERLETLDAAISEKGRQGFSARLTAGYCWPWSKDLEPDGSLREDVAIGSWKRPWNARPEVVGLKPGIPRAYHWAYDPGGAGQVGCIYTAQGFEFDYVGVIWGHDLRFDWTKMDWVGDPSHNFDSPVKKDKAAFLTNVKNTYRVLMTRGLKGCYVHFMDKDTEKFVRSRMAAGRSFLDD
ncbi:MAG TPA: DUF2075 domain-containing protein [Candidatus Thermoplasmatota archaeon]|nr:DUF2075 domain-containing protein [Candidatus Thermoplasmatota archaeon]